MGSEWRPVSPLNPVKSFIDDLPDSLPFLQERMPERDERPRVPDLPQSPCGFLSHPPVFIRESLDKRLNCTFIPQAGEHLRSFPSVGGILICEHRNEMVEPCQVGRIVPVSDHSGYPDSARVPDADSVPPGNLKSGDEAGELPNHTSRPFTGIIFYISGMFIILGIHKQISLCLSYTILGC